MGPILFVFSLWLLHANGQEDGDAISALQKSADYDVKSMKSEAVQTFPSHADARYKVHPGRYMVEGSDILQADMNLTRASWLCNKIATCVGFTFEGSSVDGEGSDEEDHKVHRVHFKSKFETFAGDWTSYEKLSPGAGVQKSQDITVPIPVPRELRQGSSSSPSGQSQTISFTCLTETYLGKGNDLQAVRMLPQLAPDFCARLQYGNRPCVGWTWHGANGTMSNQNVLGSPFFDETKVVYFKFRQRPGSSARWASCITINGQGGGLGQGANLIADTETQSRPVSLKAETHQEKTEEKGSRPAALLQRTDDPFQHNVECHAQGPGRLVRCHDTLTGEEITPGSSGSGNSTTGANTIQVTGSFTADADLNELTLTDSEDNAQKFFGMIDDPEVPGLTEDSHECMRNALNIPDTTTEITTEHVAQCLRGGQTDPANPVTQCAYSCIYSEICRSYVGCRTKAIENCHLHDIHCDERENGIHFAIDNSCADWARPQTKDSYAFADHGTVYQFVFCDSTYAKVDCKRTHECTDSEDEDCQFEACAKFKISYDDAGLQIKERSHPNACTRQLERCPPPPNVRGKM